MLCSTLNPVTRETTFRCLAYVSPDLVAESVVNKLQNHGKTVVLKDHLLLPIVTGRAADFSLKIQYA